MAFPLLLGDGASKSLARRTAFDPASFPDDAQERPESFVEVVQYQMATDAVDDLTAGTVGNISTQFSV